MSPPPLPKAYLNYVVFNQNFVKQTEGHQQVNGSLNISSLISLNNIIITQKGYIYIWVSNESDANLDVFFDDLKVTHTKGHILQEDHYYPFGLSINALSSSAPLSKPNKFKIQGKELQTEFGLDWFDFEARAYDPQIARTTTHDPHASRYSNLSPYSWVNNNPLSFIDPTGMDVVSTARGITLTGEDAQELFGNLQREYGNGGCDPKKEDCGDKKKAFIDPQNAPNPFDIKPPPSTPGSPTNKPLEFSIGRLLRFGGLFLSGMLMSHDTGHYASLWSDEMQQELNDLAFKESRGELSDEQKRHLNWLRDRLDYYRGGGTRQFWTNSITFKGIDVFQRDDLIDPGLVDAKGRTNLERMRKGLAPIGPDGKSINLHHMIQTPTSAIAEVTQTFHKDNHTTIHVNPNTIPSGINRNEFSAWRRSYWIHRSKGFR